MKKPLIILTGPTAVGKTDLSIMLAKSIGGEIISADSVQVYKYMDIGSAKVSQKEMDGVPHYLIDELYPDEEFNIYYFKEKAKQYINQIWSNGHIPIIAGGTGFYIQSVLYDIQFEKEDNDGSIRKELEELYDKMGATYIHDILKTIDPMSASTIHENNVKRVIRAIEYYRLTGEKISVHNETQSKKESPYDFKYYCLNMDRNKLYERIDKRVDIMVDAGLVNEVKALLDKGYKKELVSMQGIGYKEIIQYIQGNISLEDAILQIKQNTRHFAKRQLTWFRREKNVKILDYENFEFDKQLVLDYILKDVKDIID